MNRAILILVTALFLGVYVSAHPMRNATNSTNSTMNWTRQSTPMRPAFRPQSNGTFKQPMPPMNESDRVEEMAQLMGYDPSLVKMWMERGRKSRQEHHNKNKTRKRCNGTKGNWTNGTWAARPFKQHRGGKNCSDNMKMMRHWQKHQMKMMKRHWRRHNKGGRHGHGGHKGRKHGRHGEVEGKRRHHKGGRRHDERRRHGHNGHGKGGRHGDRHGGKRHGRSKGCRKHKRGDGERRRHGHGHEGRRQWRNDESNVEFGRRHRHQDQRGDNAASPVNWRHPTPSQPRDAQTTVGMAAPAPYRGEGEYGRRERDDEWRRRDDRESNEWDRESSHHKGNKKHKFVRFLVIGVVACLVFTCLLCTIKKCKRKFKGCCCRRRHGYNQQQEEYAVMPPTSVRVAQIPMTVYPQRPVQPYE